MSFAKKKMEQDDLEEELFLNSLGGHLQLLLGLLQSSSMFQTLYDLLWRLETLLLAVSLVTLLLSLAKLDKQSYVLGWVRGLFSCLNFFPLLSETGTGSSEDQSWSEVHPLTSIFSMQGRRPNNEDRAVCRKVVRFDLPEDDGDGQDVHIYAVMDGHGGDFSADYAAKHLISSFEENIQKLKILTCHQSKENKLKLYIQHFKETPKEVLKFLKISQSEYDSILGVEGKGNQPRDEKVSGDSESKSREGSKSKDDTDSESNLEEVIPKLSRNSIVLSSRNKSIEELPSLTSPAKSTGPKTPKLTPKFMPKTNQQRTPRSTMRKTLGGKKEVTGADSDILEICDFISNSGNIIYPKLIKDLVLQCDKQLLLAAKQANSIGGSTLILAIQDGGQLWVANVGDSRGVFCNETGAAVPMSYDHKPNQLKEKKRIQEAGGFVAMNGVWRVQGVLATSRALGDYPLKDKKVVVADPDVLSFSIKDHRMQFAVLATDGLWDTHSNEDAMTVIQKHLRDRDGLMGASVLSREAWSRGSLDNITVLVINLSQSSK